MKKRLFLALACTAVLSTFAQPQRKGIYDDYATPLKEYYLKLDKQTVLHKHEKPLIGVSVTSSMKGTCTKSIELAGGIPVILSGTDSQAYVEDILSQLDGLMLTGGEDITPAWYGHEPHEKAGKSNQARDEFELMLFKKATDRNIPVFGVCRGLQMINVAMGGTLYQDLPTERPSDIKHPEFEKPGIEVAHQVSIVPETELSKVLAVSALGVNSRHHQGIHQVGKGLKITAWSTDSIPEAIEAYPIKNIMAVQWHPEINAAQGDATSLRIFQAFVDRAKLYAKAKDIHSRIYSVDTHTDGPMWWARNYTLGARQDNQVSIPKMQEGFLDAQFLAAFLGQGKNDDASLQAAVEKTQQLISSIYAEVDKYKDFAGVARTPEEAMALKAQGKKAFFIGIENGYGIGKDISNIKKFYDQGVNYLTLCHSYDNLLCNSSTHTEDENKGLTEFGKQVVKEMNKVGMMIDLSHASMGTFWDVMKYSKQPVICSHSGAKACYMHDRNLTDEQLKALAQNGGVIQICIFASYMSPDRTKTDVNDVVRHIDHCVKVAGIDHVGIGSDFDGGGGVLGCAGDNDMIQITMKLLEKGYTEEQLEKIWAGNFFRVMKACRAAGK